MNELRSVLERFGRFVRSGRAGGTGPGDPALRQGPGEGDRSGQPEPARNPAWLLLEILLVTILVFFWL